MIKKNNQMLVYKHEDGLIYYGISIIIIYKLNNRNINSDRWIERCVVVAFFVNKL